MLKGISKSRRRGRRAAGLVGFGVLGDLSDVICLKSSRREEAKG